MLSQKHLDAMSDDDHFDVAEAVKRVHPSPPPLQINRVPSLTFNL